MEWRSNELDERTERNSCLAVRLEEGCEESSTFLDWRLNSENDSASRRSTLFLRLVVVVLLVFTRSHQQTLTSLPLVEKRAVRDEQVV